MPKTEPNAGLGGIPNTPPQQTQPHSPHDVRPTAGALDLNRASADEIGEIDFIGRKLALAIVDERDRRGGFRSWDELNQIPGIDAKKVAELQRAARIDRPA